MLQYLEQQAILSFSTKTFNSSLSIALIQISSIHFRIRIDLCTLRIISRVIGMALINLIFPTNNFKCPFPNNLKRISQDKIYHCNHRYLDLLKTKILSRIIWSKNQDKKRRHLVPWKLPAKFFRYKNLNIPWEKDDTGLLK